MRKKNILAMNSRLLEAQIREKNRNKPKYIDLRQTTED
jgi:hypothetical protein